jgi:hypothetical protein
MIGSGQKDVILLALYLHYTVSALLLRERAMGIEPMFQVGQDLKSISIRFLRCALGFRRPVSQFLTVFGFKPNSFAIC